MRVDADEHVADHDDPTRGSALPWHKAPHLDMHRQIKMHADEYRHTHVNIHVNIHIHIQNGTNTHTQRHIYTHSDCVTRRVKSTKGNLAPKPQNPV